MKIVIPKEAVVSVLDDLETLGILETTVFPNLEGLSREVVRKWGAQ